MGGLCSKEERDTFEDVKSANHTGPKGNANNHVAFGEHPNLAEATVPASELIALKAQLQQLQDRNTALQRELSTAKDTARSYAELQLKHQELKAEHDGLQREYESMRQQLAASGLQAQLEARAEAERKLAEVQKQYSELKSMNNQLRRRVSDLATGHAEPPVAAPAAEQPSSAADDRSRNILAKIRDSNPGSKISVAFWRSSDFKRWQGVRTVNAEVTGLALNSMQLTVLPSEVGQLTSLTALLLSNNSLTQLPATLGQLMSLTSLMLDGNNLKQLPAELCDLTQLQTLWLHDNQLASLPHALGKLTNLRQLIVNDNALEQLPQSIGELKGLTSLWLDNNKLTMLPETFSQLTELKRLRVDSALTKLVPEQFRGSGAMAESRSPRAAVAASPVLTLAPEEEDGPGREGTQASTAPSQRQEPEPEQTASCCSSAELQHQHQHQAQVEGLDRQGLVAEAHTPSTAEPPDEAVTGAAGEPSGLNRGDMCPLHAQALGPKEQCSMNSAVVAVSEVAGGMALTGDTLCLSGQPVDSQAVVEHTTSV